MSLAQDALDGAALRLLREAAPAHWDLMSIFREGIRVHVTCEPNDPSNTEGRIGSGATIAAAADAARAALEAIK